MSRRDEPHMHELRSEDLSCVDTTVGERPTIAVLTAHTPDYALGWLCQHVNRTYADRHGYPFLAHVFEPERRPGASQAERHPTWEKVRLICNALESVLTRREAADEACCSTKQPLVAEHIPCNDSRRSGNTNMHEGREDGDDCGDCGGGGGGGGGGDSDGGRSGSGGRCGDSVGGTGQGSGSSGPSATEASRRARDLARTLPVSTTHLLWIDADAVVLRQERRIEELLGQYGKSACGAADLLIGEDLTPACLVNAGVLLIRVSQWSRELWADVWDGPSSKKFYQRHFHEQSVLMKQLAVRGQVLARIKPFHSFAGGPELKLFKRVVVLPRHAFNTNQLDGTCNFIFHAAGSWGRRKQGLTKRLALDIVLQRAGLHRLAEDAVYPSVVAADSHGPVSENGISNPKRAFAFTQSEDSNV